MNGLDPSNTENLARVIVNKYTDDGMLAPNDEQWNKRHQHTPSIFNQKNHHHYKQYFDKQF